MAQGPEHLIDVLEDGFTLGDWQVLPHTNTLVRLNGAGRPGERVHVSSKPMQVLVRLASQPGAFVSKDDILATVWADRVVTEDVVTGAVRALRRALCDDARNPVLIETRKGSGYRLIAPVRAMTQAPTERRLSRPVTAVVGLILAVFLAATPWLFGRDSREPTTVAVLPFMSITGDQRDVYVASAITDGLITDLAQHDGVQVISRTSVLRYADQRESLPRIAAELGADYLVEGTVLSGESELRISAQLIDARNDTHVWASRFDRRFDDILPIQREVAEQIARRVVGAVTAAPLRSVPDLAGEALESWLRARYWLAQEDPDQAQSALAVFEELALQHPGHAAPLLGKAQAQLLLFKHYRLPVEELADALASVERVIAIDPASAEAYRCYGQIVFFKDWDFVAAENAYRHAIDLNASDTVARQRYAWLLVALQRYDDALRQIERIRLVDPHYYASQDGAMLLLFSGRHAEAVAELERLNATAPGSTRTLRLLAVAYWAMGRHAESTAALIDSRQAAGDSGDLLRAVLVSEGQAGVYRHLLSAGIFDTPVARAALYSQLGDSEATLEWLERAVSVRDPAVLFLDARPEFAPLHGDPRFQALVRQVRPTR